MKRIKLNEPDVGWRENRAVKRVMSSGTLTQGAETVKFESNFSNFVGVKHAIAITSATTGLQLALWSLDIGEGDEVIVPDYSWPASGNSVIAVGAKPVFADIEIRSFNLDVSKLESLVSPSTKAIMPVHAFGQMANMPEIMSFANDKGLSVIEDAACAVGSFFNGSHAGTFGDAAVFSFHPRKILTTGEGGVLVTNSDSVAEKAKRGRVHGARRSGSKLEFEDFGFNFRMTEFQAAMGVVQLSRHKEISTKRERNAGLLANLLEDIEKLKMPKVTEGAHHSFQSFVVMLEEGINRDALIASLDSFGVEATLGTYSHLAQKSYSREFGDAAAKQVPNSQYAYKHALSLPMHGRLNDADLKKISTSLRRSIEENRPS